MGRVSSHRNPNYSQRPKTGRPDFGVLESCQVPKRPDFRHSSEIRTILSGYRTSGWIQFVCPVIGRPVQTSEIQTILSGFRTFGQFCRPKPVQNRFGTGFGRFGRLEPDIRNPDDVKWMNRTSEIRTILSGFQMNVWNPEVWEPDNFRKCRNPDVRFSDVDCI